MANDLLSAVTSNSSFDLKTLNETFSTIANANLKRQELALTAQANVQKYGLQEQLNKVREAGSDVLAKTRELKLNEATKALQDASDYTDDIASSTKDGKPLAVRLRSTDPVEADEAYQTFAGIRDKWRGSVSPIVQKDLKAMEDLPIVQQKAKLAQDAEARRKADEERKQQQGDRRLDQKDTIIADTEGVNADKSAQGWTRIQTGQQNATTRERMTDARIESLGSGGLGITVPGVGKMSMEKIRSVLAAGIADGATKQQASDADVLRKGILAIHDGKNPDTNAPIPRFTNDDIVKWTQEGSAATKAPKPNTPAPSSSSSAEPALPSGGVTGNQTREEAVRQALEAAQTQLLPPPSAPTAVPAPAPSSPSAPASGGDVTPLMPAPLPSTPASPLDRLRQKYKLRPAAPTGSYSPGPDPSTPDALISATQNYLAGLGLVSGPPSPTGFGGFGLPAA